MDPDMQAPGRGPRRETDAGQGNGGIVLPAEAPTHFAMMKVHGQDSFLLKTNSVELALSKSGGCLGPVTFFPADTDPIRPYAIAPWAEEPLGVDTPAVIKHLRGDWFCSAFGANQEMHRGKLLPLHGETANSAWYAVDRGETSAGTWLRLRVDLPLQDGFCEATTALMAGQSIVYQRHDFTGLTGPINPGHHATLAFPERVGSGRLSFSRLSIARTFVVPTERPEHRGYSCLKSDVDLKDLHQAPCINGSRTDLCRYPARRGFDDMAILCTDPKVELGWSAVSFPEQRYVWFSLRNPQQLTCTLLWFSNGGRHFLPWNGRHVNVMGVEDMTGFFHVGLAASSRPNALTERGIRTYLDPDPGGRLSIPYIQGVARIPGNFDQVADIKRAEDGSITLLADSGVAVKVPCHLAFLQTGSLPQVGFL
jgi:hypothetical protein